MLLRLGTIGSFVDHIMNCVCSMSYSFLLNDSQFGFLQLGKGLRQGDPLSPYLFISMVEAFIGLLAQAKREGKIRGIQVARQAPIIFSLCFANDTLLFCRASEVEATSLKEVLDTYAAVSGQLINCEKSSMTFSRGMSLELRNQIKTILGVME